MPKSKEETLKIKNERKKLLIIAGLKVFCEKGYRNATVDDIVKKANCSHGLFYHYFSTKEELFNAIIGQKSETTEKAMKNILTSDCKVINKLEQIINFFFDNFTKNENFAYYFYFFMSNLFILKHTDISQPENEINFSKVENHHKLEYVLENLFNKGQQEGEIITEYSPKECAILLQTIIQGATLNYIMSSKNENSKICLPKTDFIIKIFKND